MKLLNKLDEDPHESTVCCWRHAFTVWDEEEVNGNSNSYSYWFVDFEIIILMIISVENQ